MQSANRQQVFMLGLVRIVTVKAVNIYPQMNVDALWAQNGWMGKGVYWLKAIGSLKYPKKNQARAGITV